MNDLHALFELWLPVALALLAIEWLWCSFIASPPVPWRTAGWIALAALLWPLLGIYVIWATCGLIVDLVRMRQRGRS